MRKLINHVRSQPDHVRGLVAGLCTLAVALAVGLVWFHSFKQNTYALLNPAPDQAADERVFASNTTSLFGYIGKFFSGTKAQISNFIHSDKDVTVKEDANTTIEPRQSHPLPVSGEK